LITYETAKEAWLKEALSVDLQELPEDFLADLARTIELVEERTADLGQDEPRKSLMLAEKEKLKTFLRQMVEIRCAKLAVRASEGRDPTVLNQPEKKLLEDLKRLVDPYKERFYRLPGEAEGATPPMASSPELALTLPARPPEMAPVQTREKVKETAQVRRPERNEILRIVREFPSFVGPDLKGYGPFAKEDIVAFPGDVSGILFGRKVAERVRPAGE